jgi:DUF971 family protein
MARQILGEDWLPTTWPAPTPVASSGCWSDPARAASMALRPGTGEPLCNDRPPAMQARRITPTPGSRHPTPMSALESPAHAPHRCTRPRVLEVGFDDGAQFRIPFELMRVYSPSAEVQGHGPGQEVLQTGKREVGIDHIEPVGHYAVQPRSATATTAASSPGTTCTNLGATQAELWQLRAAPGRGRRRPRRPDGRAGGGGLRHHTEDRGSPWPDPLRLPDGRRGRQGRARARRVRLRGLALRRDERPDVDGPAPGLEGLHRGRGRCGRATRCSTSPAAPATWPAPSPARWAPPAWWCTPTSTKPCCAPAATACSTKAWCCPPLVCDAEQAAVCRAAASTWSAWPSACAT